MYLYIFVFDKQKLIFQCLVFFPKKLILLMHFVMELRGYCCPCLWTCWHWWWFLTRWSRTMCIRKWGCLQSYTFLLQRFIWSEKLLNILSTLGSLNSLCKLERLRKLIVLRHFIIIKPSHTQLINKTIN